MSTAAQSPRPEHKGYVQSTVDSVKGAAGAVMENVKRVVGVTPNKTDGAPDQEHTGSDIRSHSSDKLEEQQPRSQRSADDKHHQQIDSKESSEHEGKGFVQASVENVKEAVGAVVENVKEAAVAVVENVKDAAVAVADNAKGAIGAGHAKEHHEEEHKHGTPSTESQSTNEIPPPGDSATSSKGESKSSMQRVMDSFKWADPSGASALDAAEAASSPSEKRSPGAPEAGAKGLTHDDSGNRIRHEEQKAPKDAGALRQSYVQGAIDTVKGTAGAATDTIKQAVGMGNDQSQGGHDGKERQATPESPAPSRTALAPPSELRAAQQADVAALPQGRPAASPPASGLRAAELRAAERIAAGSSPVLAGGASAPTAREVSHTKAKEPDAASASKVRELVQGAFDNVRKGHSYVSERGKWAVGAVQDNRIGEYLQPTASRASDAVTNAATRAAVPPSPERRVELMETAEEKKTAEEAPAAKAAHKVEGDKRCELETGQDTAVSSKKGGEAGQDKVLSSKTGGEAGQDKVLSSKKGGEAGQDKAASSKKAGEDKAEKQGGKEEGAAGEKPKGFFGRLGDRVRGVRRGGMTQLRKVGMFGKNRRDDVKDAAGEAAHDLKDNWKTLTGQLHDKDAVKRTRETQAAREREAAEKREHGEPATSSNVKGSEVAKGGNAAAAQSKP